MRSAGRDKRRRLTESERRTLYARSGGQCQRCGAGLGADFHSSHLAAWSKGGATSIENMQAWCPPCNLGLGAESVTAVGQLTLRTWQSKALKAITEELFRAGVATLHAAPGAGKTFFAGVVFKLLLEAGLIDRLIIVVPNTALLEQWRDALAKLGIHLDTSPRDGHLEHPDTVGAIVTYQSLPNTAAAHATTMHQHPTLVVFDEVHHVGEKASWGRAVATMVGDIEAGTHAAVLNMTGTLFRSSRFQRISTVRYNRVPTLEGEKLLAVADYSVPTKVLIGVELRGPDLYAYGGKASLVDILAEDVITADIADLDVGQRKAVLRLATGNKQWLEGFCREAVRLLQTQQHALPTEPLKLLHVAGDIKAARAAADAYNRVTGQGDFARLVTSDQPDALKTLRAAARENRSCAIVAVKMVTEGFDCPQVATIAYATNVTADLFIAQTMARAMRITGGERADKRMLPAQVLIPDVPELRKAFAAAMQATMHEVEDKDEESPGLGGEGGPMLPRYELLDLDSPLLRSATVLTQDDGEVLTAELEQYLSQCQQVGIPETYAPRVAVVSRRYRPPLRTYVIDDPEQAQTTPTGGTATAVAEPPPAVVVQQANPRTINEAYRKRMKAAAGYMLTHFDHDQRFDSIQKFQMTANKVADIPTGGRDHATSRQLSAAEQWMRKMVVMHCEEHGEPIPDWAGGSGA